MLRFVVRLKVRHVAITLAALLTLGLMATSASAQVDIDDSQFPGGAGPGQNIGGGGEPDDPPDNDADVDVEPPAGSGGSGSGVPSGQSGASGSGSLNGADGADQFGGSPRDQGRPGQPGSGQPGRSGNPSPTPAVNRQSPGARTIPSYAPPLPGSRTNQTSAQTSQASGQPLLPFDVIPSPFPTLDPSPSPSPSPSPTDLVAAIDNLDPDPVADEGTSIVPLLAVLAGAALLFVYFRSRRRTARARLSGGRSYR